MAARKLEAMVQHIVLLTICAFISVVCSLAQNPSPLEPATPAAQQQEEAMVPGDWAPELLDAILSSPDPAARESLLDAAFAAGPAIVPQLEAALKDDRTAEFAAQSLAFCGGNEALDILSKLAKDPRDLDLRRFLYGALGELRTSQATQALLDALAHADAEPDRTVTEAAIIALTVRSDLSLLPHLRETDKQIKDIVIRDDIENAVEVIEARARYMASPEGKNAGGSVEQEIRTYFIPALEPSASPRVPTKPPVQSTKPENSTHTPPSQAKPEASVEVQKVTFSPDKTRALAHVVFQDPLALAKYDMVLQKEYGDWIIASVWLGDETEKTVPDPNLKPAPVK